MISKFRLKKKVCKTLFLDNDIYIKNVGRVRFLLASIKGHCHFPYANVFINYIVNRTCVAISTTATEKQLNISQGMLQLYIIS